MIDKNEILKVQMITHNYKLLTHTLNGGLEEVLILSHIYNVSKYIKKSIAPNQQPAVLMPIKTLISITMSTRFTALSKIKFWLNHGIILKSKKERDNLTSSYIIPNYEGCRIYDKLDLLWHMNPRKDMNLIQETIAYIINAGKKNIKTNP